MPSPHCMAHLLLSLQFPEAQAEIIALIVCTAVCIEYCLLLIFKTKEPEAMREFCHQKQT